MANPQTEKGYTRIANEILDHILKINLNGTQFRIVMLLWRLTYGYRRKDRELSLAYISKALETTKGHIDRELTSLIERHIVNVIGIGPRRGRILSFNKNYEEWTDRETASIHPEPKNKTQKQKSKKRQAKQYALDSSYYKMAVYFYNQVSAVAKAEGLNHLIIKADLQKWSDDMRKLIELDKVEKHLAKDVMDWVTQDSFWKTNVLSARKLREKFSELALKMKVSQKPRHPVQQQPKDSRDKDIEFQRWVAEGKDPDAFDWGK